MSPPSGLPSAAEDALGAVGPLDSAAVTPIESEGPTVTLPMAVAQIEEAALTDIGRFRKRNEDYFMTHSQRLCSETPDGPRLHTRGLYILCDGMGGHAQGDIASREAATLFSEVLLRHWGESLPTSSQIQEAVLAAHEALYQANQRRSAMGTGRMGTTLVALLVQDAQAAIVHVGDSRAYRYTRRQGLERLTRDHSISEQLIRRGIEPEVAYAQPDGHQLVQAIGPVDHDRLQPEIQYFEISCDMLFLLCSDGLSDRNLLEQCADSHVAPLLRSSTYLPEGVQNLISIGNKMNGHDNLTAIAVRVKVRPNLSVAQ
jgi:protein phosphatase